MDASRLFPARLGSPREQKLCRIHIWARRVVFGTSITAQATGTERVNECAVTEHRHGPATLGCPRKCRSWASSPGKAPRAGLPSEGVARDTKPGNRQTRTLTHDGEGGGRGYHFTPPTGSGCARSIFLFFKIRVGVLFVAVTQENLVNFPT